MASASFASFNQQHPPPPAPQDQSADWYHGVRIEDPFRPLEALDSPATKEWAAAQNRRFEQFLAKDDAYAQRLASLRAALDYPKEGLPHRCGSRYFSSYHDGKSQQGVYRVQDSLDGPARIVIDPNALDEGGKYALSGVYPSRDGSRVAYFLMEAGSDYQTLFIRDVATGKDIDCIPRCRFSSFLWDRDSADDFTYSYPVEEADKKYRALKHHRVGRDMAQDETLYVRAVDQNFPHYFYLRDETGAWGAYDFISEHVGTSRANALYFKPKGTSQPYQPLFADSKHTLMPVAEVKGEIYAVTNLDAPRFKLVAIDPARPQPQHWRTVISEHAQDVLQGTHFHQGQWFVRYRHDTADRIAIHDMQGKPLRDLPFPPQSAIHKGHANPEDTELYFSVSSFQTPNDHYRYDLKTQTLSLWKPSQAKDNLRDAVVERITATSKDGTQVPMTVIRRRDVALDGTAAAKLYGYGGYGISLGPHFSPSIAQWVKEGGIYVQANIRGGGEFGTHWHEQARGRNRQKSYDDFIACAEALVAKGYSSPKRLAIEGGSNGGQLTLAVMLQRPDLFGAVVAHVPTTDMLRFAKHEYGAAWKQEKGDPEHSAEDFKAIMGYSPLHNVKQGAVYPPMLVTTAEGDNRVVPSHAYKFVATMQQKADPSTLCLLRVEKDAGHGAGKSRDKSMASAVDTLTFCEQTLGPIDQKRFKAQQGMPERGKEPAAQTCKPNPVVINITLHPTAARPQIGFN